MKNKFGVGEAWKRLQKQIYETKWYEFRKRYKLRKAMKFLNRLVYLFGDNLKFEGGEL